MSRLLHVLALLSLLLFAAAPASAVMLRSEKTAVPGFFGSSWESASGDECPASQYRTRSGVDCSYEPALDVRDGPNLYAYVRQNPWTSFDPDGLFEVVASLQHLIRGDFMMALDAMASPIPGDANGPIGMMRAGQAQAQETAAIYKTGRDIGRSHEESRNTALFHGAMKMTGGITLMQGINGERQQVNGEGHIENKQSTTMERVQDVLTGGLQLTATAVTLTKAGQGMTNSSKGTVAQAEVIVEQNVPAANPGPARMPALPAGEAPYQLKLFPDEAYNRTAHYGNTPTAAQRASVPPGMEFDHNPTLVKHYYEGDGAGGLPGFNLTQTERLQHARSLSSGSAATPAQQRAQGASAAAYSKQKKKENGL